MNDFHDQLNTCPLQSVMQISNNLRWLLERFDFELEQEKANKEKLLREMEERMNGKFDVIELKVKRSMK
jgi:hypothetical protein